MDVNAVMLLKNVLNWLYFDQSMGKWGENFVLACCTVAVREGWNWDTTSLQVTCSFVLRILLRSELVIWKLSNHDRLPERDVLSTLKSLG